MHPIQAAIAARQARQVAEPAKVSGSWRMFAASLHGLCVQRREKLGLSQAAAAKRIGVGRATLQRWEASKSSPGVDNLFRWADGLGIEITAAVREEGIGCDADTNSRSSAQAVEAVAERPATAERPAHPQASVTAGETATLSAGNGGRSAHGGRRGQCGGATALPSQSVDIPPGGVTATLDGAEPPRRPNSQCAPVAA